MYRGQPPHGKLLNIRNPYIDPSVICSNNSYDQRSLLLGPVFAIEIDDFKWTPLRPNSSSATTSSASKSINKFQKLMCNVKYSIIIKIDFLATLTCC